MSVAGDALLKSFALMAEDTRTGPSAKAQEMFSVVASVSDDPIAIAVYAARCGYEA